MSVFGVKQILRCALRMKLDGPVILNETKDLLSNDSLLVERYDFTGGPLLEWRSVNSST